MLLMFDLNLFINTEIISHRTNQVSLVTEQIFVIINIIIIYIKFVSVVYDVYYFIHLIYKNK